MRLIVSIEAKIRGAIFKMMLLFILVKQVFLDIRPSNSDIGHRKLFTTKSVA